MPFDVDLKSSNRITICGQTGTGKTEFARFLMKLLHNDANAVGVLDPLDQYGDIHPDIKRIVPPPNREAQAFDQLCAEFWAKGNGTIFGEEAERYVPQQGKVLDNIELVNLRGRNRGVGMVLITRRIAQLDKQVFSLADHVFIFRHFAPGDVDYLARFLGKDNAARIRAMPNFHFAHFAHDKVTFMNPIEMVSQDGKEKPNRPG